jgi:hypothetical protein
VIGPEDVDAALDRAEAALAEGHGLRGTGFWPAVDLARRDVAVAERYGDQIAAIDRRAFEQGVRLRVPLVPGLLVLLAITCFGGLAVFFATTIGYVERFAGGYCGPNVYECPPHEIYAGMFLLGTAALVVGTHSLAHWVVGRLAGIHFTHVFLGGPPPPRPGVKIDYASYLRTSPRARAVMHASGAVVTKILPFALVGASIWLYEPWPWLTWILIGIGIFQIVTDVALSTKTSDWKKVLRELRAARGG